MRFSYATPKEITSRIKFILPSSAQIIEYVNQALGPFEIFYHAHGVAIEILEDQNGHRRPVVGYGKSGRWVGA